MNPSYLGKEACTVTADRDRAASEFSSYTYPRHQIESPKRPTKNSTQGRLPLTRLSKIHPLILIL